VHSKAIVDDEVIDGDDANRNREEDSEVEGNGS
jgi:hypothetical protein